MSNGLASKLLLDLTAELLSRGNSVRFRPSGRSMYPSIQEGELITVEPVQPPDVKREDIILYRSERGVIAHRVVEVSGSQAEPSAYGAAGFSLRASSNNSQRDALVFRMQGDASVCCDEPVKGRQILGRVVFVERNGRSVHLASRRSKILHRLRVFASRLRRTIRRQLLVLRLGVDGVLACQSRRLRRADAVNAMDATNGAAESQWLSPERLRRIYPRLSTIWFLIWQVCREVSK